MNPRTDILFRHLRERILVLDGGMGTMIQRFGLDEDAFRGSRLKDHHSPLKGNNDLLSLTGPEIVREIHNDFLAAGSDMIETNTFTATSISQADYGTESLVFEMNRTGAEIATAAALEWSGRTPDKPRFVAGSIGPSNPSLSMSPDVSDPGYRTATFDQVAAAYSEQVAGLLAGGVDILLVETIFDTLNAKAAIFAIAQEFLRTGTACPVMVSGTIADQSGRTLSGQSTEAFWISISHTPHLMSVGLNCALGSEQMRPYIETLSRIAAVRTSLYPNAGLPDEFGEDNESPAFMASTVEA
ncbi:MAG: homocysteine S-methyltransferase family protein, partial [Bacteroidetes bacterium]|nr:homocysteine S-methyltransferase family protein [Bacteroidota bacterium]